MIEMTRAQLPKYIVKVMVDVDMNPTPLESYWEGGLLTN
jgi:hypothetical protein